MIGGCTQKIEVKKFWALGPRPSHHFVGNIKADYLAVIAEAFSDHAAGPSVATAQIKNALSGSESHSVERLVGNPQVIELHALAHPVFCPQVEFMAQAHFSRIKP